MSDLADVVREEAEDSGKMLVESRWIVDNDGPAEQQDSAFIERAVHRDPMARVADEVEQWPRQIQS